MDDAHMMPSVVASTGSTEAAAELPPPVASTFGHSLLSPLDRTPVSGGCMEPLLAPRPGNGATSENASELAQATKQYSGHPAPSSDMAATSRAKAAQTDGDVAAYSSVRSHGETLLSATTRATSPAQQQLHTPHTPRASSPFSAARESELGVHTPTHASGAKLTRTAASAGDHPAADGTGQRPRRSRENFTSEQLAFLRQLYSSGVTRTSCHLEIQAAANQLGISYDRVKNWINNHNKRLRRLVELNERRRLAEATGLPWPPPRRHTAETPTSPVSHKLTNGGSGSSPSTAMSIDASSYGGLAAGPKRARSVTSEHSYGDRRSQKSPRIEALTTANEIDLLVMHGDEIAGALPVAGQTPLISVVRSCYSAFSSILPQRFIAGRTHPRATRPVPLLAAQLNDPAGMHLHNGVLIFLDAEANADDTGDRKNTFCHALMEVGADGQPRCLYAPKNDSNSEPLGHDDARSFFHDDERMHSSESMLADDHSLRRSFATNDIHVHGAAHEDAGHSEQIASASKQTASQPRASIVVRVMDQAQAPSAANHEVSAA
ncbi:hypothetical protein THASP1DRAFT_29302 [Thamnocephalis sphaerospora]|uniref:Homeobox domain-containing protein n=1 Tax=Thamnocephalis sphaerospora TaxID=78915 RepID=A0A4P9XS17_9FUNG|nr:hypothetical protein THASP1DRAFT_29302 [Thamnocephalis sphaerospora]|eukprot:RKP08914.1 hypothetical protein THASP1DRAFT_29302 [Thamnocephalis sphaerospora]